MSILDVPVVQSVKSTSEQSTIPKLDEIFALFGIALILKTGNGLPFQSNEFKSFCRLHSIKHRCITPLYPQANGTMERFMHTLNKAVRAAVTEDSNWVTELHKFLRNYRATPAFSNKDNTICGHVCKGNLKPNYLHSR